MSLSISSLFSSIFPVVHADSDEKPTNGLEAKQEAAEEPASEAAPAEEEDEPEDVSYEFFMFRSSGDL
jgi:ubiquinol-cytochrome c reductase subunit 6